MPCKFTDGRRHKFSKAKYRATNWPEYDSALVRRGSLTGWFTQEAIAAWHAPATGERGGQPIYSAIAIETGLALRLVFRQPLRQTEGLLRSIADVLRIDITIPDHTTLSRRGGGLTILPSAPIAWSPSIFLSLDQIDAEVASLTADGAYDGVAVYDAVAERHPEAAVIIPPRATARPNETTTTQRDRYIAEISNHGRMGWQRSSGYNRRSLAETAMYRYKTVVGRRLHARTLANQRTETKVGCNVLNWMTTLGMPVTVRIR